MRNIPMTGSGFAVSAAIAVFGSTPAFAQEAQPLPVQSVSAPQPQTPSEADEDITVTGWRLRQLDKDTSTASRLGLSIRETPATIDQIGGEEMLTRGFRTVEEATVSLPGVTSGGSPGNPVLLSMRGFSGEQITILHNGLYLGRRT